MAFLRLGALTWARTPGRFHDGEHHGHYSGLLRLPNLATMQLKYQDQFFMTAPNQRRKKAASQIPGPPSPTAPAPGSAASAHAPKLRRGDGADREAEFTT